MRTRTKKRLIWAALALVALPFVCLAAMTPEALLTTLFVGMAVTANQIIKRQNGERATAPIAASTTIYEGTLVFITSTGYADDDTASGANTFGGVAVDKYDNSSGSAGDVDAEYMTCGVFTLTGSGFSQADVGAVCYATDNFTITTTYAEGAVVIGVVEEYVSATELRVAIGKQITKAVKKITQAVAFGDMTDNTDTTGYLDWDTQLPAGAIPLGVKYVVGTGFTGDTSAAVQTGVSGDLDRFSSATDQSVLAAATVGHGVAADACDGMNAAQTIRTTITGAADFTSISAGALTATLYYLDTADMP